MKLPWEKKYLVISFHVVVTLLLIYSLKYCIDFFAYVLSNLNKIFHNLGQGMSWILSIFSVVIIAFIISYLLDPIVDFFQKKYIIFSSKYLKSKDTKNNKKRKKNKQGRTAGVSITYILIFLIFILIGTILFIKIKNSGNGNNILESVTNYIRGSVESFVNDFSNLYAKFEGYLVESGVFEYISPHINNFVKGFTSFVASIGNGVVGFISSITNGIINVVVGLVISFYFLKDKMAIKEKFENIGIAFLHKRVFNFIKNSLGDIHAVFSGYIRGTLLDATIMATLISIGLSLIKVRFALIIGLVAGFSNIIPYFGALVGFLLAISVSLIGGEPMKALYATLIMAALQQIDTIFIAPKVIGESVELSPVLVIIALSVAGQIFGLWGMVFAVPSFAVIKLFASRIYHRQKLKKAIED